MTDKDLKEIEELFHRSIGVFAEIIQHKLDLVIEGQKMLAEKMDGVEERLGRKIDAVAADLSAHRADTEIHRGYKVSERE